AITVEPAGLASVVERLEEQVAAGVDRGLLRVQGHVAEPDVLAPPDAVRDVARRGVARRIHGLDIVPVVDEEALVPTRPASTAVRTGLIRRVVQLVVHRVRDAGGDVDDAATAHVHGEPCTLLAVEPVEVLALGRDRDVAADVLQHTLARAGPDVDEIDVVAAATPRDLPAIRQVGPAERNVCIATAREHDLRDIERGELHDAAVPQVHHGLIGPPAFALELPELH